MAGLVETVVMETFEVNNKTPHGDKQTTNNGRRWISRLWFTWLNQLQQRFDFGLFNRSLRRYCLQMFIFHVEKHPKFPWYEQCVSFNTFTSRTHEMLYVVISMVLMYALPLCIFIFTYGSIIYEIAQRSRQEKSTFHLKMASWIGIKLNFLLRLDISETHEDGIRRLTGSTLGRARIKTVKMTVTIVGVFIVCWTPYYVMTIW